ncbi:4'-phosphopantetheinyl transferase [Micromonospora phaseoli]|uniref:4'-phosphopantetheinyl transferase n=1 Tax=Micromonospora phaseoli TaxID=1144548 RepID=A0A1H7DSZ0_9ACTN|nr:4'-phosphopantetheinyl transferase superfamily protein [Micromonospora phaseoli]PZV99197.1 4'-phosphopantetheinyl transferase [Micromonospora phaseoli]GIJ80007.1 hypothetical protein Xph01_44390 [Micromonospora phaseoli]SEK04881.1 4'-phosphopantetheinyl transferase [Micromonospora phaseoli]
MRTTPGVRRTALPDGVFVACARLRDLRRSPVDPADSLDLAGGRGLPEWRVTERLAARRLLRALVNAVGGTTRPLTVGHRAGGQPYLPGHPTFEVSLAHSGALVAAAVHTRGGAVGVDVQVPYPVGETLVRRCCPRGADVLLRQGRPARDQAVARIWTAQESCAKATGQGLGIRPWLIPVDPDQEHGRWRQLRWQALPEFDGTPWSCAWEPVDDNAGKGATP